MLLQEKRMTILLRTTVVRWSDRSTARVSSSYRDTVIQALTIVR